MFERETNREKNLEKAVKEAKVKARKEAAKTSDNDKDRAMDEQDILKVLSECLHNADMYTKHGLWPKLLAAMLDSEIACTCSAWVLLCLPTSPCVALCLCSNHATALPHFLFMKLII